MAQYKIPSPEFETLKKISDMSDSVFAELTEALKRSADTTEQLNFASKLADELKSVGVADIRAFVRTIANLYAIMASAEKSAETIASDIKETVESEKPADFPAIKSAVLKERLQKWLSIGGSLALIAKSFRVMSSQDKIFCNVQIFSDLRPVFGDNPAVISAAVPIHTLSIHYHEGGQFKQFFAAMSVSDLGSLKKTLERAEKKNATLKAFIQKTGGVRYLEEGE